MYKLLSAAVVALGLGTGAAAADAGGNIGTLTCKLVDVTNVVVYTNQTFACEFNHTNGELETYTGSIDKVGVDLSLKKNVTMIWAVVAPVDNKFENGALAGIYVGGGADIALVGGVGAKVLVGGGDNSFSLQPLSVTGIRGTGASLGLESFKLE